jgi:hypothetical protein
MKPLPIASKHEDCAVVLISEGEDGTFFPAAWDPQCGWWPCKIRIKDGFTSYVGYRPPRPIRPTHWVPLPGTGSWSDYCKSK